MTHREPSPLARGVAAGASTLVLVAFVVHAQWGCDLVVADEVEPSVTAPDPPADPTPPKVEPIEDEPRTEPAAPRGEADRQGAETIERSVYLGSTKSDPDMWTHWAATREIGEVGELPLGMIGRAHEGEAEDEDEAEAAEDRPR